MKPLGCLLEELIPSDSSTTPQGTKSSVHAFHQSAPEEGHSNRIWSNVSKQVEPSIRHNPIQNFKTPAGTVHSFLPARACEGLPFFPRSAASTPRTGGGKEEREIAQHDVCCHHERKLNISNEGDASVRFSSVLCIQLLFCSNARWSPK